MTHKLERDEYKFSCSEIQENNEAHANSRHRIGKTVRSPCSEYFFSKLSSFSMLSRVYIIFSRYKIFVLLHT